MKKKVLNILLVIFMLISNTYVTFANEDVEFYAYTTDNLGFDEYAYEEFSGFLYGHYGYVNNEIKLGKGITIYNENDYQKVLYPVWENNVIIATFIVVNVNGVYSGTYSEMYKDSLEDLKKITTFRTPMLLIVSNDKLYASINDVNYNLSINNEDISISSEKISFDVEQSKIINANEKIDFESTIIPRYPSSKRLNWTVYSNLQPYYTEELDDSNPNGYCASYCLYNILRNSGINSYSLNSIKNSITYFGKTVDNVKSYLKSKNLSYKHSTSYLNLSNVINEIYSNDSYILIFTRRINFTNADDDLQGFGHAMVLSGYSILDSGVNTYSVWDPVFSSRKTMDADTRIVVSDAAFSFQWNADCIYNIGQ